MLFIVLEGIDGSGKGTQSRLLNRWIRSRGFDTFLTMEPTTGKIGRILREGLKTGEFNSRTEALLFSADRMEHIIEIMKKLEEGKVVVCDRYMYSSIAYQGASGVDREWLKEINRHAPHSDLVLYLDLRAEIGLQRINSKNSLRSSVRDKEYFEKLEFLEKVREEYQTLSLENKNFAVIDATESISDVQTQIRKRVGRLLSQWIGEKESSKQQELNRFF